MKFSEKLFTVDVETTGNSPFIHSLLSVAFVQAINPVNTLSIFVRYPNPVWNDFAKENFKKFEIAWEQSAVTPEEAARRIEAFFSDGNVTLIGHNVGFDIGFLNKLAYSLNKPRLDGIAHRSVDTHTLLYMAALKGQIPWDAVSSSGAFAYFEIQPPEELRHTAIGDAIATKQLFEKLIAL